MRTLTDVLGSVKRSFGPGVGMNLLDVREAVLQALKADDIDEEARKVLQTYADALEVVCRIGALHQGVILSRLGGLLGLEK